MEKSTTQIAEQPRRRRTHIGKVLKNKMDKTVVVSVNRSFVHPLYKKVIRKTIRLKVHDAKNECQVEDRVEIQEIRPMSKEKHWRINKIIERSGQPGSIPGQSDA